MGFFNWLNSNIKKLSWWHISLIKLSSVAFAFMFAALVPGVLGLAWYWYLIFTILLAVGPAIRIFSR